MDGVPMAIRTLHCTKTFHVERLLGSLPISWGWRLCWTHGNEEVLEKPIAQFCMSRHTGKVHRSLALENTDHMYSHSERNYGSF